MAICSTIFGCVLDFLPVLREAPEGSRRSPAPSRRPRPAGNFLQLIPSSLAAVPPRMVMRSSSLRPGIDMMWSTGTRFHGNG